MGRLSGKTCVITGIGGGMGAAAARVFAREGAFVIGCDVHADRAEEVLRDILGRGGQMVSRHPCDMTRPEDCRAVVDMALSATGRLDVLYNNAAMAYFQPFQTMTDKAWHDTINEELNLVFNLTRAAWDALGKNGGSVISTASISGWVGSPALGAAAHSAAKGGIIALTRQLAAEGAASGIRANSISPGLIESLQTAPHLKDPQWRSAMVQSNMLKRPGTPEEVANMALFLASDESSFVTGADFRVDGGQTALT